MQRAGRAHHHHLFLFTILSLVSARSIQIKWKEKKTSWIALSKRYLGCRQEIARQLAVNTPRLAFTLTSSRLFWCFTSETQWSCCCRWWRHFDYYSSFRDFYQKFYLLLWGHRRDTELRSSHPSESGPPRARKTVPRSSERISKSRALGKFDLKSWSAFHELSDTSCE